MENIDNETKLLDCCVHDCERVLVRVGEGGASIVESHQICTGCRTIILCDDHFDAHRSEAENFACPACGSRDWSLVEKSTGGMSDVSSNLAQHFTPLYAHELAASSRLFSHCLSADIGEEYAVINSLISPITLKVKGSLIWAAASESGHRVAVLLTQGEEEVLEIHSGSGRPWRIRFEEPSGIQSLVFLDDERFAVIMVRGEGLRELYEGSLEVNHTVLMRRVRVVGAGIDGMETVPITRIDDDRIFTLSQRVSSVFLEEISIGSGRLLGSCPLPYLPVNIISNDDSYCVVIGSDERIGLVRDGRFVELFERFSLLEAAFMPNRMLCLSTVKSTLVINLNTGESNERVWSEPLKGLIRSA